MIPDEIQSPAMTAEWEQRLKLIERGEDDPDAFMTGIISGLGYAVNSNQENGLGRSDIAVREIRRKRGMILEAKKSDKEEDMEKDALEGRQQIIDKEYLRDFKGFDSVKCYGISFFKKKALVKKLEI